MGRYTSPEVAVKVTLTQENDHAVLSVSDHGTGIPLYEHARMTERFTRGDAARTQAGSGLGLALVKAVMLTHAGALDMGETPGGGLTVSLRFQWFELEDLGAEVFLFMAYLKNGTHPLEIRTAKRQKSEGVSLSSPLHFYWMT